MVETSYAHANKVNENQHTQVANDLLLAKDTGRIDCVDMVMRKPLHTVISTLFKQTTREKVVLISCEDAPQTIMAAAYWLINPDTSIFILCFNILLPLLRITFAGVAYPILRRAAQPSLRDELLEATMNRNEAKVANLMRHISDSKLDALIKA